MLAEGRGSEVLGAGRPSGVGRRGGWASPAGRPRRGSGGRPTAAAPGRASAPTSRRRPSSAPSPTARRPCRTAPASARRARSRTATRAARSARPGGRPARGWWRTRPRRRPTRWRRTVPSTAPRSRTRSGSAPWPVSNMPYGAIDGWWSPERPGTSPATVHLVPWNACTPTMPASSDVRTTRPWPVRGPLVQRGQHPEGAVHAGDEVGDRHADLGRLGGPGDRHQAALALGDLVVAGPASPPGPSWPNPVIESTTSPGLSSCSRSTGKPSRSSTPTR